MSKGAIVRGRDVGTSSVVTGNGERVGELSPLRADRFMCAEAVLAIYAHEVSAGGTVRGPSGPDLLMAAAAGAVELPHSTRNPGDSSGLDGLVEVVAL
jgi:predicted nucleic acid-binding protein